MNVTTLAKDAVLTRYVLENRPVRQVSGAGQVYTAQDVLEGVLERDTGGLAVVDTLPPAVFLVSVAESRNRSVQMGTSFTFVLHVLDGASSGSLELIPGSGNIIRGPSTFTVGSSARVTVVFESVVDGVERVSYYIVKSYLSEDTRALSVPYSPFASGLQATNVQDAIAELSGAFYRFRIRPNLNHINVPPGWSVVLTDDYYEVTHNLGRRVYVFAFAPQQVNFRRRAQVSSVGFNSYRLSVFSASGANKTTVEDIQQIVYVPSDA